MMGTAAPTAWAAAATAGDVEVQQWINRHAQQVQAAEVPSARHRVVGDLDGDGRNEVAVLYTLKARMGQRGDLRYLAVFKSQREASGGTRRDVVRYQAHVLVLGPGAGEANRVTILNRALVVDMLTYAPGDAACCPTRASKRHYRLMGAHGLQLVRPETVRRPR